MGNSRVARTRLSAGACCAFLLFTTDSFALGPAKDLADQTVPTPIGPLQLTKLRCDVAFGSVFLWGTVTNTTGRAWDNAMFTVHARDASGTLTLQSPVLLVKNLGAGAPVKFSFSSPSTTKADKSSLSETVELLDGAFPVTYSIKLVKPAPDDFLNYTSENFTIAFQPKIDSIPFKLVNASDMPIKIDWNVAAFVDMTGRSSAVIHNGIKFAQSHDVKAPTIIPPGATLEDGVVPADNIELVNSDWITRPFLPMGGPMALKLVGSQYTLFLPMEINGKSQNFSFVFGVTAIQ